jgi:hypothetical protein
VRLVAANCKQLKPVELAVPLLQYFVWVGSFLLALLFAANWFAPGTAARPLFPEAPLNEKITIRIHSQHERPERVVFDTTRSTLDSTSAAIAETDVRPSQQRRSGRAASTALDCAEVATDGQPCQDDLRAQRAVNKRVAHGAGGAD